MNPRRLLSLLFALCLAATVGCDSDDDSENGNGDGAGGSCIDYSDNAECIDYTGADWDSASADIHCSNMGGTHSDSACTSTDRVGRCTINSGDGMEYDHNYYEEAAEAENACDANNGDWTAD